jgi:ATP-dependent exoDNAse (exonuclease V) beta subunit
MTKTVTFTNRQKEALDLSTGKLVVAGAGSGKTTVLAERYLRLLESGLEPSQIVAMTFTRKAAASLRGRVYGRIQEREAEQPERASLWRKRRDDMRDARITTIHAFCGTVLRAYPDAAGVDPEMTVGPKAGLVQLQTVREHIRTLAYRRDETLHELLAIFPSQRQKKAETLCLLLLRNLPLFSAIELAEHGLDEADDYLRRATQIIASQFEGEKQIAGKVIAHRQWLQALISARKVVTPLLPKADEPRAALSFDDLEHTVLAFLRGNTGAARHLRDSIKALLVDEFQDTSLLQWEIVRELVRNEQGTLEGRKLFLVGDEKQSIYSFRDANVTVLHKARQELCAPDGQVTEVRLVENFRTRPALMRTLNPILDRLLRISKFKESAFVAQPQEMKPGRKSDETGVLETALVLDGTHSGPMDYIVEWIRGNVVPDEGLEGLKGTVEPRNSANLYSEKEIFTYSNTAILLKTRTRLPELELALQLAEIPYSVNAGQGFYTRPEVLDLIHLVHTFADPRDLLARVALLRSPMFGLSDTAVAAIYMNRPSGADPWQNWVDTGVEPDLFASLDAEDRSVLERARPIWRELQRSAGLMDTVDWLRIALDRSGAWGAYAVGRRGRQALANIAQFLELIRDITTEQGPDLRSLVDRLDVEIDREDGETDAEADVSGGRGVQIMTIHSAKGLEFPLVILALPDTLQKRDSKLTRGNLAAEEGKYRPLTEPRLYELAKPFIDEKRVTNLHDVMYNVSSLEEDLAEQLRLLYVAATRARDRLLVVTHAKRKAETKKGGPARLDAGKRSSSELWLQACDLDLNAMHDRCGLTTTLLGDEQAGNDLLKTATDMRFVWLEADALIATAETTQPDLLPPEPPALSAKADPGVKLASTRPGVRLQLPLEAFASWMADSSKQNLDKLLHLGAEDGPNSSILGWGEKDTASLKDISDFEGSGDREEQHDVPRLSGILLHNLVQRFGPGADWERVGAWVVERCKSLVGNTALRKELVDRVKLLAEAGAAHDWKIAAKARREFPVMFRIGDIMLRGRIDLAWLDNGSAVALDLKTNDISAKKVDELVRNHGYDHQARLYAMAYAASSGSSRAEGRLLFLPSGIEKQFDVSENDRQYYVSRATELVRLAEEFQASAYTQESMK